MLKNKRIRGWGTVMISLFLSANLLLTCAVNAAETIETRKNKKGQVDRWIYRRDGVVYKREYDRNGDGKPDFRVIENHGRLIQKEYDTHYNGKFDKIEKPLAHGSSGRVKTMDTENTIPS